MTETVSVLAPPGAPASQRESGADRRARTLRAVVTAAQRSGIAVVVLAAIVGIWAAVCAIWHMPAAELPTPSAVWSAMGANWGTIWGDTEPTVLESVAGYAISIAAGIPLGFLLSRPGWLSTGLNTGTVAMQIFPKICLAPLFLVWFGFGYFPKILFVVLLGFFPIAMNAAAGFASVPSDVRELGVIIGFGPLARLRRLNGPWALPQIFTGLKISASFIVIAAIVIEFTGAESGLGVLIVQSQTSLNLSLTFATVIIVAIVGFLVYGLVSLAEYAAIPWHVSRRHK
jgi:NitT/TauT family transport system permease protein